MNHQTHSSLLLKEGILLPWRLRPSDLHHVFFSMRFSNIFPSGWTNPSEKICASPIGSPPENKNIFESSTRLHTFHLCIGKTTSTAICHVSMANNIILLIWGDRVDFSQIVEKQSINHICFKNHQEMTMFLFTYEYIKSVVQLIQGLTQSLHF